jgi:hypothetical protein
MSVDESNTPDPIDWIIYALEVRKKALAKIGACSSPRCMCLADLDVDHHANDCFCYDRKHAMIELAKINSRFADEVKKAVDGAK